MSDKNVTAKVIGIAAVLWGALALREGIRFMKEVGWSAKMYYNAVGSLVLPGGLILAGIGLLFVRVEQRTYTRVIAVLAVILGVAALLPAAFFIIRALWDFSAFASAWGLYLALATIIVSFVLPVALIVGGIALLLMKEWGRVVLLVGLSIHILFGLAGIIRNWYTTLTVGGARAIPADSYRVVTSLVPTYVIVFVEIVALYLLLRPESKDLISVKGRETALTEGENDA
jgi:hypothetical protein